MYILIIISKGIANRISINKPASSNLKRDREWNRGVRLNNQTPSTILHVAASQLRKKSTDSPSWICWGRRCGFAWWDFRCIGNNTIFFRINTSSERMRSEAPIPSWRSRLSTGRFRLCNHFTQLSNVANVAPERRKVLNLCRRIKQSPQNTFAPPEPKTRAPKLNVSRLVWDCHPFEPSLLLPNFAATVQQLLSKYGVCKYNTHSFWKQQSWTFRNVDI